jgi:putative acetyltransferase
MTPRDYGAAADLWRQSEGVRLTEVDTEDAISGYLERNPGLSLVALHDGRLVGTILGGHDGRRGYLHHLAVHESARRRGIGSDLVKDCMARLRAAGIVKAHVFVVAENEAAREFYASLGWEARDDLVLMSRRMDDSGMCPPGGSAGG